MQITDLPQEIILHIEIFINDITLLEDLIFVNKYFRKIFMDRLNENTLNFFGVPYNSYTYYSSDIKEKIFREEDKIYKVCYCESVKYNAIKIGTIEKYKTTEQDLSYLRHIYKTKKDFKNDTVARRPFWKCCCYVSRKYNTYTLADKQFGIDMNIDINARILPTSMLHIANWQTHAKFPNHLTQYFTKEMAIEQVIYHYNQLSK